MANASAIRILYRELYEEHPLCEQGFEQLMHIIAEAAGKRPLFLKQKDEEKAQKDHWYLSNEIAGMSLYVDRFCGELVIILFTQSNCLFNFLISKFYNFITL